MKNHSHQADGRTVVQVLLRPLQWWARNPWVVFWGSMALIPFLLILMAVLLDRPIGYEGWIIMGGLLGTILVVLVSIGWWVISVALDRRKSPGARVLEVLAILAVPLLLAAIAVPNLLAAQRKGKIGRAEMDTRQAVTQAIEYGRAKGRYPTSLKELRAAGYPSLSAKDLWGQDYVLAPILTRGGTPTAGDDVYVYSKGPCRTGTYEPTRWKKEENLDRYWDSGKCGPIGHSSVHGTFIVQRP